MKKIKIIQVSILVFTVISLLVKLILQKYPTLIETVYSTQLNKTFIKTLSQLTGVIPFSLFELLILTFIIGIIGYFIMIIHNAIQQPSILLSMIGQATLSLLTLASFVYLVFLYFWGFNYDRVSFNESIGLVTSQPSQDDLARLYSNLIILANELRDQIPDSENDYFKYPGTYLEIFSNASLGYDEAAKTYPILSGDYGKPKALFISELMNYTKITGVYSPFTGEANVNIAVDDVTLLFSTMHEMAHQRGFASEDEANFIAYITCINHPDVHFQYAGYLTAILYVNHALLNEDIVTLRELNKQLSQEVITDMRYKSEFWKKYESKVENVATVMNNTYLKLNGVQDGVKSYGRMIDSLLAYYEKFEYTP